jgi:hypothetical protein
MATRPALAYVEPLRSDQIYLAFGSRLRGGAMPNTNARITHPRNKKAALRVRGGRYLDPATHENSFTTASTLPFEDRFEEGRNIRREHECVNLTGGLGREIGQPDTQAGNHVLCGLGSYAHGFQPCDEISCEDTRAQITEERLAHAVAHRKRKGLRAVGKSQTVLSGITARHRFS